MTPQATSAAASSRLAHRSPRPPGPSVGQPTASPINRRHTHRHRADAHEDAPVGARAERHHDERGAGHHGDRHRAERGTPAGERRSPPTCPTGRRTARRATPLATPAPGQSPPGCLKREQRHVRYRVPCDWALRRRYAAPTTALLFSPGCERVAGRASDDRNGRAARVAGRCRRAPASWQSESAEQLAPRPAPARASESERAGSRVADPGSWPTS